MSGTFLKLFYPFELHSRAILIGAEVGTWKLRNVFIVNEKEKSMPFSLQCFFRVSEALPKFLYIYNEAAKKKGAFKSPLLNFQ